MKKVKLIWVFSGPNAEELAKEKEQNLEGIGDGNEIEYYSGTEYISHISWLAYFIVSEDDRLKYLSEDKPTRQEDFED